MTISRLLAAGMMVCVLTASAGAEDKGQKGDNAKLLVGKWQTTKPHKETPLGTVFEFSKDGKLRVTLKEGGKEERIEGAYTLQGDKIQYTLRFCGRDEKKDPLTIKKITEKQLIIRGGEGEPLELKRIK